MDTPDRNQIGTSVSNVEESPFSNFANSLSPINATNTTRISQTFSSLTFTSPPSIFTSPHAGLQNEPKFLRRHQVSDRAKTQFSCDEGSNDSKSEQILSCGQQPQYSINRVVRSDGGSSSEASDDPLPGTPKSGAELPKVLEYDRRSPDCEIGTSSGIEEKSELGMSAALVPYVQEPSVASYGAELNSQQMDHDNEEAACDWQSLISGSTDMFVFDSPNDEAPLKGSFEKSLEEETDVYPSLLSCFPPDNVNGAQNSRYVGPLVCDEAQDILDKSTQPTEINELVPIDQPSQIRTISSMNDYIYVDSIEKPGNESYLNLHRGLRRRCLVFDMPRAKKSMGGVLFSNSSSSLSEESAVSYNRQPSSPERDSSSCMLPGIGLHLNALATASKDCNVLNQELPSPTNEEPHINSLALVSSEKDVDPAEDGLEVVEDASQVSFYAATEELNSNSPKKKRRKFENIGEGESCKRCNCKKSKCLKLYCECFAAGIYCVEPCSCQDCFNKPIHEETVLATRKQIESRNPLAFAPKVIRTLDSAQELVEDSSRTPASARHKRGCNCKKSNCLKKYCECYQGGVGCSISCRCEGCKNAFGRKDGPTLLGAETEIEEAQAPGKRATDKSSNLPAFHDNDDDQNSEITLPQTPMRLFRPSILLSTSSKGKPPRSSIAIISSSSCLHPIGGPGRSTFLRSQRKMEKLQGPSGEEIPTLLQNGSPPSGVKTLSPNSKRISPPHNENRLSSGFRSSRKLILQSIPAFPSLTPRR